MEYYLLFVVKNIVLRYMVLREVYIFLIVVFIFIDSSWASLHSWMVL